MVSLFNASNVNRILLCGILTTFTLAVLTPPTAYAQTGLNDITFSSRVEKLIKKMWKYKDQKNGDKILDTMLDIKLEVEGYTGQKIDLDKEFSKAKSEIKKKGQRLLKRTLRK